MVWNTAYHITYKGPDALKDSIPRIMAEVGGSLSVFDSSSLVNKVNNAKISIIDYHFKEVYECSRKVNEMSEGTFDPTLSPLITVWGFGKGHEATADTLRIDSILEFVGIEKTCLNGNRLSKADERIEFNFSAIAKGYGCDEIGRMFERNGVKDYLIEIGGEVLSKGVSPSGGKWKISIDRPIETKTNEIHDSQAIILISDKGVATSGNYRNFQEINGRKFGHTIDRKTGRPIQTQIVSSTVIADNCMLADALATTLMAMTDSKVKSFCLRHNIAAMLVYQNADVWYSPSFKKYISD